MFVVGTNAIFAYEAVAGIFVESGLLATSDIDLHYDVRRGLSLAFADIRERGLIGLLQQIDHSFTKRAYRAINRDGYIVDLIRPEPKEVFRDRSPASLSNLPDDLAGAPIFGLTWLISSPKIEAVPLDERGYPLRTVVIDPRVFALHKIWMSKRPDREPLKIRRDIEQARAAAAIATQYLRLPFDSDALNALPVDLRNLLPEATEKQQSRDSGRTEPNW